MNQRWPLRIILPVGVLLVFMGVIAISLGNGLIKRQAVLQQQAEQEIQREVARLARITERLLRIDQQLLEDDITQASTDPRAVAAAIVLPSGKVLFSSNFAWRDKDITQVVPSFTREKFKQITQGRMAHIENDANLHRLVAIMSYVYPEREHDLRSLNKGLVYLVYDLSSALREAGTEAVKERMPEMIAIMLVALLLVGLLHRFVASPLAQMEAAARAIAAGDFDAQLKPKGPEEIKGLTLAFNDMSAQLSEYLNELDNQSRHTQAILDNVIDGIVTIDERGIITLLNKSAEHIFGYHADEVIGCDVNLLMPGPYCSVHDGYLAHYNKTGEARVMGVGREVKGKRKDGSTFPMDLAVSEITYQGLPLFIGIVRDITERKRVERMKNEFVSTVSHELRTPLTSISGSLGLLTSGVMGNITEKGQQMLDIAYKNSKRLSYLINDLLDMEKLAAGKMAFNLKLQPIMPLIEQALEVNQSYGEKLQVSFELIEKIDEGLVQVDGDRVQQVLSNLLSNAAKFSPMGSVVKVAVRKLNNSVRVEVIDNGPGIPEGLQHRVFQKFFQADSSDTRQKGGTGLGLAISKELIEQMNGLIGFDSEESQGTRFYIELPLWRNKG